MNTRNLILGGVGGVAVVGLIVWLVIEASGGLTAIWLQPEAPFSEQTAPPAPDYTKPAAWAAFPGQKSMANERPDGERAADPARKARVNVFFVHPTTWLSDENWNDRFDREDDDILHYGVLRVQAGAFNQCCQIYAPRYRQATLWAFIGDEPSANKSLKFAYQDVRRAFARFLVLNKNKPFILASHSQGSLHATRLLQEEIAPKRKVARRMVAAYLVGFAVPTDIGTGRITPCKTPRATGCYINWNSVTPKYDQPYWTKTGKIWDKGELVEIGSRGGKLTCVNPLNWRLGGGAESSAKNKGSLSVEDMVQEKLPRLAPVPVGARCSDDGLLVLSDADKLDSDMFQSGMTDNGDYHVYDYHLFYANLRDNIGQRINAFFEEGN